MTAERLERRAARFNGRTTVYTNTSISRAGMQGITVREKSQPNSQPKQSTVTVDRDSRFLSVGVHSVDLGTVILNPFPKFILNGWSHTLGVITQCRGCGSRASRGALRAFVEKGCLAGDECL